MRAFAYFLMGAAVLFCGTANASIIQWSAADDGDGGIVCPPQSWSGVASTVTIAMTGNQYFGPAHILGSVTTDTEVDPTITLRTAVDNDTSFAWTGYHVNVAMNKPFTISAEQVFLPSDWSIAISSQPVLQSSGQWVGQYLGQLDLTGGAAIPVGGTLDFGYSATFIGSVQFCQEFIPVPEPTLLGLATIGLLGLIRRR